MSPRAVWYGRSGRSGRPPLLAMSATVCSAIAADTTGMTVAPVPVANSHPACRSASTVAAPWLGKANPGEEHVELVMWYGLARQRDDLETGSRQNVEPGDVLTVSTPAPRRPAGRRSDRSCARPGRARNRARATADRRRRRCTARRPSRGTVSGSLEETHAVRSRDRSEGHVGLAGSGTDTPSTGHDELDRGTVGAHPEVAADGGS